MGTFIKKEDKIIQDRALVQGLKKLLEEREAIILDGVRYTRAELTKILEERAAISEAVNKARAQWLDAVRRERESEEKTAHLVSVLRQTVRLMQGAKNPSLVDFGMEPHKEKRQLTSEEKVAVVEKILATRQARHTMGKRQRLAIKGRPMPEDGIATDPSVPDHLRAS